MSRRRLLTLRPIIAVVLIASMAIGAALGTGAQKGPPKGPPEWRLPNNDLGNHRVADSRISASNVGDLEVAWTKDVNATTRYGSFASMPIIADGTVYLHDLASNVTARRSRDRGDQVDPGLRRARHRPQRAEPAGRDPLRRHGHLGVRPRRGDRGRALACQAGHGSSAHRRPRGARRPGLRRHDHARRRRPGVRPRRTDGRDPVDLQHPEGPLGHPAAQPSRRHLEHAARRPEGRRLLRHGQRVHHPAASCSRTRPRCSTPTASSSCRAASGKLKWHYQAVPNDLYDWDLHLSPMWIPNQKRPMVVTAGKMGYIYAVDPVDREADLEDPGGRPQRPRQRRAQGAREPGQRDPHAPDGGAARGLRRGRDQHGLRGRRGLRRDREPRRPR